VPLVDGRPPPEGGPLTVTVAMRWDPQLKVPCKLLGYPRAGRAFGGVTAPGPGGDSDPGSACPDTTWPPAATPGPGRGSRWYLARSAAQGGAEPF
jgi:hypothetical protein